MQIFLLNSKKSSTFADMKSILFICHGNICRSPMAEYVFRQLAFEAGKADDYKVSSAAVSYEETGNDIYPPAKRTLAAHHIPYAHHAAHRMQLAEYHEYDYIVCADRSNIRLLRAIIGDDPDGKVSLLMHWAGENRDVSDPWYTGDFETAYRDIVAGCTGLLQQI